MVVFFSGNNFIHIDNDKLKFIDVNDIESDKLIITNNSLVFEERFTNVIDLHVWLWLVNNYYKKIEFNYNNILKLITNLGKKYGGLIELAKKYTYFYRIINSRVKFDVNKVNLAKKIDIYYYRNNKKVSEELSKLYNTKDMYYCFINPTGRIYLKGFNINIIDRKNNFDIFYNGGDLYLIDYNNFEPSCLNFYLDDFFIGNDFYDTNYEKFGYNNRNEFKESFISWLNGKKNELFDIEFKSIVKLRESLLKQNKIKNIFGREMNVDERYKVLGYLIQSTASDYMKIIISNLEKTKIHYILHDELLVDSVEEFILKETSFYYKYEKVF